MARLYLFAVGGTGARVLRALTHLLAAGAPLKDSSGHRMELVPLVIDPDALNFDTLDCLGTLDAYTELRSKYLGPHYSGSFYGTQISRFEDLDSRAILKPEEKESFRCGVVDSAAAQTFREVIDYNLIPPDSSTRLFIDAIYSKQNLDTRLTGGFLGNPNLGTVVLSKIRASSQFRMLPGVVHEKDRIFIISSIFGGTGASGFPVLVKLLRDAKDEQGHDLTVLRTTPIGALTVLPYFSLAQDQKSAIDSNAFVPKTKAALSYYADHLAGVQGLYYIGDKAGGQYPNRPAGQEQRNQDHVVEFLGATAVLHFAKATVTSGSPPSFKELAVASDPNTGAIDFSSIGDELAGMIGRPMTMFAMMTRFLQQAAGDPVLSRLLVQPWAKEGGFDEDFFMNGVSYKAWRNSVKLWWESVDQAQQNRPAFRAFGTTLANLRSDLAAPRLTTDVVNMAMNALRGHEYGVKGSLGRFAQMFGAATERLHEKFYQQSVGNA